MATEQHACSARFLQLVRRLRFDATRTQSALPLLIVSSRRGGEHKVSEPFTSGLCESQIHVPLWIDLGVKHSSRIQSLTGSHDLLPTLGEFLAGAESSAKRDIPPEDTHPAGPGQLSHRPMSLAGTCRHRKQLPDRLLRLMGDSWTALRTQQYLLVQQRAPSGRLSDAQEESEEALHSNRQLYLKPEDLWNVNDAIVSCAEIAEQMEAAAASEHDSSGGR